MKFLALIRFHEEHQTVLEKWKLAEEKAEKKPHGRYRTELS